VIVGVDVGTSVTKAAAFDEGGEVLAVEARPTRLSHPGPGRVEQDAEEVFASVVDVLGRLRAAVGRDPGAIGVTGQGDGLWLLDGDGVGVAPAVSWMDGRASGLVDEWMRDGRFAELFRRTGNAPFPGAAAPILSVLQRADPVSLDRAATAAKCKDMVVQRLTGIRATDLSDASNLVTDIFTARRDESLLDLLDLSGRAALLPPVHSQLPLGELTAAAARATGLRPGTSVTSGPYDLPACAAGAGVTAPGDGLLIVGTTLACEVIVDRLDLTGEPAGQTLLLSGAASRPGENATQAGRSGESAAHAGRPGESAAGAGSGGGEAASGGWLRAMPAMTGTAALDWVLRLVGAGHERLGDLLAESPPGAHGVRVLPYLSPAGERAPFVAPGVRGRVDGLELARTGADLVRAFCEGLAFAARHCFEAAGLTGDVAVCGGGAASRPWLQIFADVMGRPLRIARGPEVGARGAALAAAGRTGLPLDAGAWTHSTEWVEPGPSPTYDELYSRYLTDVRSLRGESGIRSSR
jgi:xylulokinase